MQLTTILAIIISCLVLLTSVTYTDSSSIKTKPLRIHSNRFVNSPNYIAPTRALKKNGRRRTAVQAIIESIR